MVNSQVENADRFGSNDVQGSERGQEHLLADSLMVGVGRRQVADQCPQRPLVALDEAADRLDVCRQHPPDRIEVVVHGALPCCTELPLRGYTAGPGKSSPASRGSEASTNDLTTRSCLREQDREINGLIDVLGTRTPSTALQTIENAAGFKIGPSWALIAKADNARRVKSLATAQCKSSGHLATDA